MAKLSRPSLNLAHGRSFLHITENLSDIHRQLSCSLQYNSLQSSLQNKHFSEFPSANIIN